MHHDMPGRRTKKVLKQGLAETSHTGPITRLPPEVLDIIVENVAGHRDLADIHDSVGNEIRNDLKKVRLVNKAFAWAIAPILFNEVAIWLSIESLDKLTKVSEHPVL